MIDQKLPMNEQAPDELYFQRVGKELPYKVPEGFFDTMPERTLQNAKARFGKHRREMLFKRGFVVFAAAAAILVFVFFLPKDEIKLKDRLVAKVLVKQSPSVADVEYVKPTAIKADKKIVSAKAPTVVSDEENLDDILASLSEEELTELLTVYKSEDLEEVLSIETTNTN